MFVLSHQVSGETLKLTQDFGDFKLIKTLVLHKTSSQRTDHAYYLHRVGV
jgi:hypothetical protein